MGLLKILSNRYDLFKDKINNHIAFDQKGIQYDKKPIIFGSIRIKIFEGGGAGIR